MGRLVNRVVSDNRILAEAVALAEEVAAKPPRTISVALSVIHRGTDASIDGPAIEEAAYAAIVPTHDAQQGVAVEKRKPRYALPVSGKVLTDYGRFSAIGRRASFTLPSLSPERKPGRERHLGTRHRSYH